MSLPQYVDYGGLVCCPPPFSCLNTKLDGFFVEADGDKLDALCKRVFADTTNGAFEYAALGHYVMLAWGECDALSLWPHSEKPGDVPWNERGGVREPQVCVWVPVTRVKREGGKRKAEKFAWFLPYIWVDNAMSLATGRETLGYPKSFGRIAFPAGGGAREWTLDSFGLNYSPASRADFHPLLKVTQSGGFGDTFDEQFDTLVDLGSHVANKLFGTTNPAEVRTDLDFLGSIFKMLLTKTMYQVFLKQIRSAEDGLGAALQQVVEAHYKITNFKGLPYPHLSAFDLKVLPLRSHPLLDDLGLADQEVKAAYHIDMDFEVRGGTVLWDAAGNVTPPANGHHGIGRLIDWIPFIGHWRTGAPA